MLRFRWFGLRLRLMVVHRLLITQFNIHPTLVQHGRLLRMERLHRLLRLLLV